MLNFLYNLMEVKLYVNISRKYGVLSFSDFYLGGFMLKRSLFKIVFLVLKARSLYVVGGL